MNRPNWGNSTYNNNNLNDSLDMKVQNLIDKINANKTQTKRQNRTYIFDNLNSPNCGIMPRGPCNSTNNKIKDIFNYISDSRNAPSPTKNYCFSPSRFNMGISDQFSNTNRYGRGFNHQRGLSSASPREMNTSINYKSNNMNIPSHRNYTSNLDFSNTFGPQRKMNNHNNSVLTGSSSPSNLLSVTIKNQMREMAKAKNQDNNYWGNQNNIFKNYKNINEERKKNENPFSNFEERRRCRRNFDRNYFNQELDTFKDKLFVDKNLGGNTSPNYKRNRFNRLKLNL